jgi:hypothetical protein
MRAVWGAIGRHHSWDEIGAESVFEALQDISLHLNRLELIAGDLKDVPLLSLAMDDVLLQLAIHHFFLFEIRIGLGYALFDFLSASSDVTNLVFVDTDRGTEVHQERIQRSLTFRIYGVVSASIVLGVPTAARMALVVVAMNHSVQGSSERHGSSRSWMEIVQGQKSAVIAPNGLEDVFSRRTKK